MLARYNGLISFGACVNSFSIVEGSSILEALVGTKGTFTKRDRIKQIWVTSI